MTYEDAKNKAVKLYENNRIAYYETPARERAHEEAQGDILLTVLKSCFGVDDLDIMEIEASARETARINKIYNS